MHLLALTVDISHDLSFVGDSCLLLFHETISDALDLGTNRVKSIIVILNPVFLLLNNRSFELIPLDIHKTS